MQVRRRHRKERLGLVLVLVAAAGCKDRASPPAAPPVARVADAAPPPADAAPPRAQGCPPATFAMPVVGGGLSIHDVGADCRATLVTSLDTEDAVLAVAWPSRDRPLVALVQDKDATEPPYLLVFDQPLADAGQRPVPRRLVPPGKGATEPDGHELTIMTDGQKVYVERCKAWDDGTDGDSPEGSEEWSCTQHLYFAFDDPAGKRAKALASEPAEAFAPVFAGGQVPGTGVTLALGKSPTCAVNGKTVALDPWGAANHGRPITPITVRPISATDWLLGTIDHGSRMHPTRSVHYTVMHGCEEGSRLYDVHLGPAPYQVEKLDDQHHTIRAGAGRTVLDEAGQPWKSQFTPLAWTSR
jgi:hypothetical protein